MKKLNYIIETSKLIIKDLEEARKDIETKLHYFMFMWLGIISGIFTLFGKTYNIYDNYISKELYVIFSTCTLIYIIIITYLFFKVYNYKGRYAYNNNVESFEDLHKNKNIKLKKLMNVDWNAQSECIILNRKLNNVRNNKLNSLKKNFKWFICMLFLFLFITIIMIF